MTQEYIVTEEKLERALAYRIRVLPFMCQNEREDWENFIESCRSHPYNPQAERDKTLNEFYDRLKVERDPIFDGVSWDDVDAVFIKLRKGEP